ncbi:MAG: aminotransferase class III-fold pyridoxal phosphate-dependent enzyme, partial [Chloroflexi bacterium]|nr:aminotransferase class III-fold pyridoxal phosphate-dependent enzyme [Chloroflexota bacterium]
LAKGLGGGVPIGAVLAKQHAAVFEPGDHGSTFGGNPLATAAALYVMRQVIEGDVMDNARARGEQLERHLASMEDRHESVAGHRGRGLLRALVFREEIAGEVVGRALSAGLILNAVRPNAVRFIPPLTVTAEEIDRAAAIVDGILRELDA